MSTEQHAGGNRPLQARLRSLAHLVYDSVIDPVLRHARSRAGERELAQLDDRLLRDIGLTRAQVHAAAWGLVGPGERSLADSMRAPRSDPDNVVRLKRRAIAWRVDEAAAAPLAKRATGT